MFLRPRIPCRRVRATRDGDSPGCAGGGFWFVGILVLAALVVLGGLAFLFLRTLGSVNRGGATGKSVASGSATRPGVATGDIAESRGAAGLQENQVRVFFTPDGLKLQPQVMDLPRTMNAHERLRFVLEELLRGPTANQLRPTVPEGTQLRGAFIGNGTVVVDLSSAVSQPLGGPMAEILCVYSIVNTAIANTEGAQSVRILVEGQSPAVLWDQVDLAEPLVADFSLIGRW